MSEQLTLQDWEKLFNMVKASEASDKELREKIAQLEERLKRSEARIPKTGLLSHSMLTRILTVCGYVFFASIISSLVVWLFAILRLLSFPIQIGGSSWQTTSLPSIIILFLVIMIIVILVRKARQTENDVEFIN